MAETLFVARIIGASLLSVALFISAFIKKNALISTVIIIMGIALFILLSGN
ncbi:hypothetical protein HYS49_01590 [Candidatus Woesearchaeota archaeon]|nr:hypothetical protein [Candidatus Woesearchaeota archaeon]